MSQISALQAGIAQSGSPLKAENSLRNADSPAKIHDAAQQFESLLLSQILSQVSAGSGGWLGSGGDDSAAAATGFAEQQLAASIAQQGGLGLANLIAQGLQRKS